MPREVFDAGLQPERTRLSWSRTALAIAANVALLLHSGVTGESLLGYVPAMLVLLCAIAFWLCGVARYRFVRAAVRDGRGVADERIVRVAGLLAVLPGIIALIFLAL